MSEAYPHALPKGTRIEEYEIHRVLGQGGFGITYLAFDHNLNGPVALKEYFPAGHARRLRNGDVGPTSHDSREHFEWGRKRFLEEAQAVHRLRHPNVVRALRYFEAKGGAYIVMEYVEGDSLAKILASRGRLSPAEWSPLFSGILDGLAHVHEQDYLHRDIKPGNIVIRDEGGAPVLIDFGSARAATGERTNTQVLTPGYAPLEQHGTGKQTPSSDLYSLGAVSYRVLLGEPPPTAPDRVLKDTVRSLAEEIAITGSAALDRCLSLHPEARPQSVVRLRAAMRSEGDRVSLKSLTGFRGRFVITRSGTGRTATQRLKIPWEAWSVRLWVGRRSSGALQGAAFAPFPTEIWPSAGNYLKGGAVDVALTVPDKPPRLWFRSEANDAPLWEQEFDSTEDAYNELCRMEQSGELDRLARERIREDARTPKPKPPPTPITPPSENPAPPPTPATSKQPQPSQSGRSATSQASWTNVTAADARGDAEAEALEQNERHATLIVLSGAAIAITIGYLAC